MADGMAVGSRALVPSRLAPGGVAHGSRRTPRNKIGGFIALTKPRIIELLLITTVPTMVLAQGAWPRTTLVLVTLLGGTLAAGGAKSMTRSDSADPLHGVRSAQPLANRPGIAVKP